MYIKTLMAAAVVSVLAVSGARAELVTQSLPKPEYRRPILSKLRRRNL